MGQKGVSLCTQFPSFDKTSFQNALIYADDNLMVKEEISTVENLKFLHLWKLT